LSLKASTRSVRKIMRRSLKELAACAFASARLLSPESVVMRTSGLGRVAPGERDYIRLYLGVPAGT